MTSGRGVTFHRIRSRSSPKTVYLITVYQGQTASCECLGYAFNETCAHERFVLATHYDKK